MSAALGCEVTVRAVTAVVRAAKGSTVKDEQADVTVVPRRRLVR